MLNSIRNGMDPSKPKVMFVTNIQTVGGGEALLLDLVAALDIENVVLVPQGELRSELKKRGVRTRRLRGPTELHRSLHPLWPLVLIWRTLIGWVEIGHAILVERPSVIHINNLAAGMYALPPASILRKPTLWHIHDVVRSHTLEATLVRIFYRLASRLIVPSISGRASLMSIGVAEGQVEVIHSGIDTRNTFNPDVIQSAGLRQELGIPPEAIVVGAVGHVTEGKGTHVLVDAVNRLLENEARDVHLVLVGSTPAAAAVYEQKLRGQIDGDSALRERVHLLGKRDDVAALLLDIDIVVQPSIHPEAFGRSVAEAMAMKRLVLASRAGALPELIEHKTNGYLFEPNDVNDLASNLSRAIDAIPNARSMTEAARDSVVSRADAEARNRALINLYGAVVSRR